MKNEVENEIKEGDKNNKEEFKKEIIDATKKRHSKIEFITKYKVKDLKEDLDLFYLGNYYYHHFLNHGDLNYILLYNEKYYLIKEWIDENNLHIIKIKEITKDEAKKLMKEELEN